MLLLVFILINYILLHNFSKDHGICIIRKAISQTEHYRPSEQQFSYSVVYSKIITETTDQFLAWVSMMIGINNSQGSQRFRKESTKFVTY